MKYRHAYHAGNFADVHKHVTLLALLAALKRKEKGFLYLETHAGRGVYSSGSEARLGVERFMAGVAECEELQQYANAVAAFRASRGDAQAYPGSPLLAAAQLRTQDRAIFIEIDSSECRVLEQCSDSWSKTRVECGDGFALLRAHLPPAERRGLTFIDPPYEEHQDFARVESAIGESLARFANGVIAAWYPIKSERDLAGWHERVHAKFPHPMVASELWLYPRDSRVALNGSGLLIVNPPYQLAERMEAWLGQLHALLDPSGAGGHQCISFP
jgi:23S rRNA (adenine2030-N6)-methyltransferase